MKTFLEIVYTPPPLHQSLHRQAEARHFSLDGVNSLYSTALQLYHFAGKVGCHTLRPKVLGELARQRDATLFLKSITLAAQQNEEDLLRAIISDMPLVVFHSITIWEVIDKLKPEWQMPFLRGLFVKGNGITSYSEKDAIKMEGDGGARLKAFSAALGKSA
jgi:hypothetical protein